MSPKTSRAVTAGVQGDHSWSAEGGSGNKGEAVGGREKHQVKEQAINAEGFLCCNARSNKKNINL